MGCRTTKARVIALAGLFGLASLASGGTQRQELAARTSVPRMWDDAAMSTLEVPLADPGASPVHVTSATYYGIPARTIYRSYPVYAPGKEPPGYLKRLERAEPEIIFDASKLRTEADWIKAGEVVFNEPLATGDLFAFGPTTRLYVRDPAWYRATRSPVTRDGVLPFYRYVVKERGKVELGVLSCAMCHTRVMPDGSVIRGAQGNFPFDRAFAYDYRAHAGEVDAARALERMLYGAPWVKPDPLGELDTMSVERIALLHESIPPGVIARHRASPYQPVQVPDLIGVKDRRYLDRTGLQQHRSIVDLMRYAALNQGGDDLARYGTFQPLEVLGPFPDLVALVRYSDEQLFALALYVYSLEPPPNPNPRNALARRGERVFAEQGCIACHTPPLYTNNKLTLARGFTVPEAHRAKYDLLEISVGTDPGLALTTRRGTGYYKVPSLKGVWYRGPFEHNGSVATLEDWFDPRRLRDDYVPTGFRGQGVATRAVKGHTFGLNLSGVDKKALIAFLRTL